jgi:uncharacterized protein
MPRVIWFEVPADDTARAAKFYKDAFGWGTEQWGGQNYWMLSTGKDPEPGIDGAVYQRGNMKLVTNTIGVDDLDAAVAKVIAAGGTVIQPRMPVPGMGWLAYFLDTEGNLFGLMQNDPNAK